MIWINSLKSKSGFKMIGKDENNNYLYSFEKELTSEPKDENIDSEITFDIWKEKLIKKNQDYKLMSEQGLMKMYEKETQKKPMQIIYNSKITFSEWKEDLLKKDNTYMTDESLLKQFEDFLKKSIII